MRTIVSHLIAVFRSRGTLAIGATPDVGRSFLVCASCRRVVPLWRLVADKRPRRVGCVCGQQHVRPARISEWRAAYWVLVRGLLIRRVMLGRKEWDARAPVRGSMLANS